MNPYDQIERAMNREEDELAADLAEGRITITEYNRAMRDIQREAREDMREAQRDEHDRNMGGW